MLNILFWNLNKKAIEDYIADCIIENDIDIAVFSEFRGTDFDKILRDLGSMYERILSVQDERKVTLLAKTTFSVEVKQQQNRYSIYSIRTALKDYILAAIHLEDRRNYVPMQRIETIKSLVADIEETEDALKCTNTLVIGDFNAGPYDEELLSQYAFNATLFKKVLEKKMVSKSKRKKMFYNPILHYLSEDTEMYGSFYYEQGHATPFWYCLDQVITRESLAKSINHVEYLKKINTKELLKNTTPNKKISDHLPLLVNLQEVENGI